MTSRPCPAVAIRALRIARGAIAVLMALTVLTGIGAAQQAPSRLRVMSYNIHHGEGVDGTVDLQRIADVIRDARPDLVALQEVDNRTRRTGGVDQTQQLARLTGLHGHFARQIDYEGGQYGQALLSRFPLTDLTIHWLPGEPDREQRIAASGRVRIGDREIVFGSTHLHHAREEFRQRQAAELNRLFGSARGITILAGDVNARPDSRPLEILRRSWSVAGIEGPERPTFPAADPDRQIDFVLFAPPDALRVVDVRVIDEAMASDHRPLMVDFAFP